MTQTPSHPPAQPARLGRYPVRRRLGAGAFATVWLAHDDELDSPVAIKVLADNWAGDGHVRRRFVEEGRFLRKVESPYVVPVYDAGELADGRPYLVMAYADRGTLAERLREGRLEESEALEVVAQVGAGLEALHARGVLHRDIKPGNVLFRGDPPRAMVADLGLGKDLEMSSRLTMIAGTPSYVAPEQALGEPLDARADQYSLAALAHLLLAGRPPHEHASLGTAGDPPQLPPMGAGVPPALEDVVRRGLAVDRADRYPDVASFVSALRAAAEPTLREGRVPARSTRLPLVLAGLTALVVGLAAGWALFALRGGDVELTDGDSALVVSVPRAWTDSVQGGGWIPPEADRSFPALAAGTSPQWRTDGQGVFVALLPGAELPVEVPGHPECSIAGEADRSQQGGDASLTVHFTGCEGPAPVVAERVVQVSEDQLLWVQVRSEDLSTANRVLDTVAVPDL